VLSRLFVSPDRRGEELGKRLLAVAQAEAERRGERAVLDVGKDFPSAAALYESAGWLRVSRDRQVLGPGGFEVWVYVAPSERGAVPEGSTGA
jgi:GNAT superfamily N-acetyltransferase